MKEIRFSELAAFLRQGREIEFVFDSKGYSITNHSGYWYLCDDTSHVLLETLCRFEEKDILVTKTAFAVIDGQTIQQIFDGLLYEREKLSIL